MTERKQDVSETYQNSVGPLHGIHPRVIRVFLESFERVLRVSNRLPHRQKIDMPGFVACFKIAEAFLLTVTSELPFPHWNHQSLCVTFQT